MRGERIDLTPESAWFAGTNLKRAAKDYPKEVRAWLVLEVGKLVKDIDAKKTLATDEEMLFTCRAILDEYPTLKMEELRLIFDWIRMGKFGKLYERLKTAEILECIRAYEGEHRARAMEEFHTRMKAKSIERPDRKLEPLGLAALLDEVEVEEEAPKEGLGTRLRRRMGWDDDES